MGWRGGGVEANVNLTICIFLLGNSNENQVRGLPISSMSLFYIHLIVSLCQSLDSFFLFLFPLLSSNSLFLSFVPTYGQWILIFILFFIYSTNTFFKSSASLFVTPCSLELFSSLSPISLSTRSYLDSLNI